MPQPALKPSHRTIRPSTFVYCVRLARARYRTSRMGTVKHSPCDEPCTDVRQTPHIITRPPNGRQLPYLLPLAAVFLSLGISAYFAATPRTQTVTPYHPALDFCLLCALACARYRTSRMVAIKCSPCDEPCTDVPQTVRSIMLQPCSSIRQLYTGTASL